MSLYSALPPAQGQSQAAAASAAPAASASWSRITPPRFFPGRPSFPSMPRALLSRPAQSVKPAFSHPPPTAQPPAATQPLAVLPSSTQLLLAELEAADESETGDNDLMLALNTLPDVYQPHKPNEWQQYVEWKEQRAAAEAEVEAETSRKREAERLDEAEEDEHDDARHSKRQQRSFHYAYKAPTEQEDGITSEQQALSAPSMPSPPPPAAVVAAPLVEKQAALAVASGEDAYMRRLRMSSQPAAAQAPANGASQQAALPIIRLALPLPLPPPPPPRASAQSVNSSPPLVAASRVILLTVVYYHYYCLLTQRRTCHSPLPTTLIPWQYAMAPNMVSPSEVDADLEEETADECRKFGAVNACTILTLPHSSGAGDEEAVRIFVQFADVEAAMRALLGLQGRSFGKRKVQCVSFDEKRFQQGLLT